MDDLILQRQFNRYYTLWRESTVMYEEWAKQRGFSYNSVLVLYTLHEAQKGCTQKEICQQWLLPKQTVNSIFKDFERQGWAAVKPSPTDGRSRLVCLTAKGKPMAKRLVSQLHQAEMYVFKRLGQKRATRMNDDFALYIKLFKEGADEEHQVSAPNKGAKKE